MSCCFDSDENDDGMAADDEGDEQLEKSRVKIKVSL